MHSAWLMAALGAALVWAMRLDASDADGSPATAAVELPSLRLAPKPAWVGAERRASTQPSVPDGAREVPFVETAPPPALTADERQRGYLLFQRPITEPVYPNTRPFPHERLNALVGFAAPGEFEPLTLAIYPVRPLRNLRVVASALSSPAGVIAVERIDVRLATYWNVGHPMYTNVTTYRRTPELLERVTVHSAPANECQRYWLTVQVPADARAGLYRGTVTLWDDDFEQAVEIPLALRVLGFPLQKDPRKHFSAYFYVRNQTLYKGRDEAFVRRAMDNDYRAMVDFGFDMLPTFHLAYDGNRITLSGAEELDRMLAAGMRGPIPVAGDNALARMYRQMVPAGKREQHWRIDPLPPDEFYTRLAELLRGFEADRKVRGWPEIILCPTDEVAPGGKEFGVKVYAAVKAAGIRTYATKDPQRADAADYAPHVDVWCSQAYAVPFDRVVTQQRHEYWCYPNHNAGEIKDRLTMCLGGRMTYGFGLWRSGYTTLIPWHWCWTATPGDALDYLRGKHSGCGQRVDDEGQVVPAVYWACFREGYDDGRYLYTLQQAIVEREGSKDPACQAALAEGRRLLKETWEAIRVQPRYLAQGMWPAEEFEARRWMLAAATTRLLAFAATKQATAPSVLIAAPEVAAFGVDGPGVAAAPAPAGAVAEHAQQAAPTEALDVAGDWSKWENGTDEGRIEVTKAAGRGNHEGLRWAVSVDHERDGGEGGKYPIGWPRISRSFRPGELDMSRFDALEFWVRVDSTRDEVAVGRTPLGLVIASHVGSKTIYETNVDLGGGERVWIPLRFQVKQLMEQARTGVPGLPRLKGATAESWKSISKVQLFIAEENYAHRTRITFDVGEARLLRYTAPALSAVMAPRHILLPRQTLAAAFDLVGAEAVANAGHTLTAALVSADGATKSESRQALAESRHIGVAAGALEPGSYTLLLTIRDAQGQSCSEWTQAITAHAGPLHQRASNMRDAK